MSAMIGFIGLGTMGTPMALNLLKGGHVLTVWTRRPEAMTPLLTAGAAAGESAADVAAASGIIGHFPELRAAIGCCEGPRRGW